MIRNGFYCLLPAVAFATLSGCGGSDGGSSPSSSLTVPQTSFDLESTAFEEASIDIPFSVRHITGDNLYYGVFGDSEVIERIDIYANDDNTGYASVLFKPGYQLGNGTKSTNIEFNICHDYYCNEHYSGSPKSVVLTNEVTLDQQISLAESKIEVTADYNDVNIGHNVADLIQFTGSDPYQLHIEAQAGNPMVTSVNPFPALTSIGLNMTFETPSVVGGGTYSSAVTVKACYDANCAYPIEGSPITVPVDYIITGMTPTPSPDPDTGTPTTPPTNNAKVEFDNQLSHNTIDAAYSDALNVIAIVSDSPKNAVYFYSLSDAKSYEIDLTRTPTSIAVDNINGTNRFIVGHNMMITTINYNNATPQNSQTNQIFNSHDVFDLSTDGRYVWTLPSEDQWEELQIINLNDGSVKLGDVWGYYEQTKLKINPTSSALYSLTTLISPGNISRADLTDPASPAYPVSSIYHGDYQFCSDFWFNHTGTSIFTQCGVMLNASDNANEDMRYAGQITLPPTQGWPYYSAIETLDESHDSTKIAYTMQGEDRAIRVLSSSDLNLQESFTLDDSTIGNIDYPTTPKFLFYGADGKLNIVGTAITNSETHTLIFQH